MSDPVTYELRERVALVRMDDGKVNALSPALLADVRAAVERGAKEADAVVLAGRPGRFTAGFDLGVMREGASAANAMVRAGAELALLLAELPKPAVAACTGHAIAMGAVLLCAADLRVGAQGAFKIGLNEVAIGMTLPTFAMEMARQRLSPRHLGRAALLAEMWAPEAAVEAGFLDRVVAADAVVEAAVADAARLAELDARAFAGTKPRLHAASLATARESLERELPV